ncbi:hypothetical protein BX265_5002 [Streptomyces sp. TLI_235]|nr:hypothetical protein [Streptomyces sp. TLI_235]PBC72222.1 hypothetical protein BX265_6844 [Streptomyces sp. TLI_235]PBC80165.1 hypothetical protein BX265_5002 [Streptomyces sp. TLI_235]
MIRRLLALRFVRITDPWTCIELTNDMGDGWPIWPLWAPRPPKEND